MDKLELKEIKKNLSLVLVSSVMTVLVVNIAGIVISASTSYETYAGYKVYGIYAGYNAMFHLGIPMGVYLRYGDKMYGELCRSMMRAIFRALLCVQILFAVVAISVCVIIDVDTMWVKMVIVNIPLININSYFTYINQSTKRFKVDFVVQLMQSIMYVLIMILAIKGMFESYNGLLTLVTIMNVAIDMVQVVCNKEIVFGKADSMKDVKNEIEELISLGKWVLFGDVTIAFLLGIDSMFVEAFYDTTQFAVYAFGVSIVNAIYMFMLYVNNIVYPYLVRSKNMDIASSRLYGIMVGIIVAVLPTYYVLGELIELFFAKYKESIPIIKVLYVAAVLRGLTVCYFGDICKVKKKNNVFFILSTIVLLFGVGLYGFVLNANVDFYNISYMTVLISAIWYISFEIAGMNRGTSMFYKLWMIVAITLFMSISSDCLWKSIMTYLTINVGILCALICVRKRKKQKNIINDE